MELSEGKRQRLGAKKELRELYKSSCGTDFNCQKKRKHFVGSCLENAGVWNGEREKQRLGRWGEKQQQCDVTLSNFECQVN